MAQIPASDNFDTYTNGADLNTLNGGTSWGGAWTRVTGTALITNAQSVSSPNSASVIVDTNQSQYYRQFSAQVTGTTNTLSFAARVSGKTTLNTPNVTITPSIDTAGNFTHGYFRVVFNGTNGNIELTTSGETQVTLLTSFAINTWYYVYLDMDITGERVRGAVTTSTSSPPVYGSYAIGTHSTPFTQMSYFQIWASANSITTDVLYIDNIGVNSTIFSTGGNASRDQNSVRALIAASSSDGTTVIRVSADPTTHHLQVVDAATGTDHGRAVAYRDENHVPVLMAVSSSDGVTPIEVYADATTGQLLVDSA